MYLLGVTARCNCYSLRRLQSSDSKTKTPRLATAKQGVRDLML
jgi:hypothetical protein